MASDGGHFGQWGHDAHGDTTFDLAPPPPAGTGEVLPAGGWTQLWHQVGSPGLTATAHAGGGTTLWATSRGMVRLTDDAPPGRSPDHPTSVTGVRWEHAAATWSLDAGGRRIRRRVAADPADSAVLHVEVTLHPDDGVTGGGAPVRWVEGWHPMPLPLLVGGLMSRRIPAPPGYGLVDRSVWGALYGASDVSRRLTDALRRGLSRRLALRPTADEARGAVIWMPRRTIPADRPTTPAWYDEALPLVVIAGLDDSWHPERGELWTTLEPGEVRRAAVLLIDRADGIDAAIEDARSTVATGSLRTAPRLTLELPSVPWLERETGWHATMLRGELQHDAFWDRRYVSQGSAYSYIHGLQGAPRDYAIFSVPLTWIDPVAAREQLEVVMAMTAPSGAIEYAHTGRARCTSGGIHASPTDLPLFLLWAVTEHVWATGDETWLDALVPFRPGRRELGAAAESTVRERLLLAWHRIRDRIGVGPTGMMKVGSGDWADPISAMVPDRRAFHERGESAFNTAFAAHVLPRAALLLAATHPADAADMRSWAAARAEALAATWTGRWFLRGTDGIGGPVGRDHLFLDANALCLVARIGTDDQRARLVEEIAQRCIAPSPIGATILDRPHPVRFGMLAPGWDCNGGVWAAVNAFAAMGVAAHDPAVAWDLLGRQSLAAHARAYPDVWYGIWSGPDAYNAHFGSRPGETFVQPATPMAEHPIMNANAHAGPLLALLSVLGVTTGPDGVHVDRRDAPVPGEWQLHSALGTLTPAGLTRP